MVQEYDLPCPGAKIAVFLQHFVFTAIPDMILERQTPPKRCRIGAAMRPKWRTKRLCGAPGPPLPHQGLPKGIRASTNDLFGPHKLSVCLSVIYDVIQSWVGGRVAITRTSFLFGATLRIHRSSEQPRQRANLGHLISTWARWGTRASRRSHGARCGLYSQVLRKRRCHLLH